MADIKPDANDGLPADGGPIHAAAAGRVVKLGFGPGAFRLSLASAVFFSHVSRFDFGRPAVMAFFMLSGFWVARMQDGPHHQRYLGFLTSRFLRIWPQLAVAALAAHCAHRLFHLPIRGSLLSTLALIGLATRGDDIVGTIWSLDIEAQFYLLLPPILYFKSLLSNPRSLLLMAAASFGLGCALFLSTGGITAFLYFPMFAVGLSVYLLNWRMRGDLTFGLFAAALLAITVLTIPALHFTSRSHFQRDIVFMAVTLLVGPFVAWNVRQPSGLSDRLLGNLSYPFYLVHEPCIFVITSFGISLATKILALAVSIPATALLYLGVDRPVDEIRERLRIRSAPSLRPRSV
jgi:peptidoglycan/LPS O-acetylase OafA/YrhL